MILKQISFTGMLVSAVIAFSACTKTPVACFGTNVNQDSIHVNQQVTFSAYCSVNTANYTWEFYNNGDSVFFGPMVTKIFKDTGIVNVNLIVTNGDKSNSTSQNIEVLP